VRQKLPESAGYPLMAGPPVGKTIYPGDEFDADDLVPGCEPVDDEAPPDDKPAAKGRASSKEQRP
jgi:hypothetical protein